jgi:hypothetical protein
MNEERICRIHEAERQSEVDYFINKNAKAFLREQFDLWLFQYVFSGESEWTEQRIKQLQVLKDIALKVIDFISQFEDELVKIWNKPKFVLNSNYVITLDRLAARCAEPRPDPPSRVSLSAIRQHVRGLQRLDLEWSAARLLPGTVPLCKTTTV